jgi:hypothetical protein
MNGNNDFGVSFSRIAWIDKAIQNHPNVTLTARSEDIFFTVTRERGPDVRLVCLDEYACGITRVREALAAFPTANLIYVGGNWNGYTTEAKEFCLGAQIGLFNSSEITGALYSNDFWGYHKRDEDGNPWYPFNNR